MSQVDMFAAPSEIAEARRARYDVDRTPYPVAKQIVLASAPTHMGEGKGKRILDICAGSGPFSMACRSAFPLAHITALELREEESGHLTRWADDVVLGDVADLEPSLEEYDFIVGNPPFSLDDVRVKARAKDGREPEPGEVGKSRLRAFEVLVVAMRTHLRDIDSRLVLYVPMNWWHRSAPAAALAAVHNPCAAYTTPLGVVFRKDANADNMTYCAYEWTKEPHGPGWHGVDLPVLEPSRRRWSVVPGSELYVPDE